MPGLQRNGRTRRERRNADNLKAQRRQPCGRCGQRIDYTLEPPHPDAFMAGHIKSWVDNPALREDPANLQPEHNLCGWRAGRTDGERLAQGITSEDW